MQHSYYKKCALFFTWSPLLLIWGCFVGDLAPSSLAPDEKTGSLAKNDCNNIDTKQSLTGMLSFSMFYLRTNPWTHFRRCKITLYGLQDIKYFLRIPGTVSQFTGTWLQHTQTTNSPVVLYPWHQVRSQTRSGVVTQTRSFPVPLSTTRVAIQRWEDTLLINYAESTTAQPRR